MARAVPAGQVAAFSTRRGPPDPGARPTSRSTSSTRTSSRCSSRSGSRRIPASRGAEPGLNSCARGGFARGAAQRCVSELSFGPGCYCSFAPVVTRRQSRMKRIPIMHIRSSLLLLAGVVLAGACPGAHAQAREQGRLLTASQVLEELRTTRDQSIPDRLLERAYGVAVIPDLTKVAFFAGGRRGPGALGGGGKEGGLTHPAVITINRGRLGWRWGRRSHHTLPGFPTPTHRGGQHGRQED